MQIGSIELKLRGCSSRLDKFSQAQAVTVLLSNITVNVARKLSLVNCAMLCFNVEVACSAPICVNVSPGQLQVFFPCCMRRLLCFFLHCLYVIVWCSTDQVFILCYTKYEMLSLIVSKVLQLVMGTLGQLVGDTAKNLKENYESDNIQTV